MLDDALVAGADTIIVISFDSPASGNRQSAPRRQRIDRSAPPQPCTQEGRDQLDALLQSGAGTFAGTLRVSDTTLFSSTAGGVDDLRRLWSNIVQRPRRA